MTKSMNSDKLIMEDFYLQTKSNIEEFEIDLVALKAKDNVLASHLEQAIRHFEKAKSLIRNPEKTVQAAVELNMAREIGIPYLLTSTIVSSLSLSDKGYSSTGQLNITGQHRFINGPDKKTSHFWVPFFWRVNIIPSFDPPAVLLNLARDQHLFGGFGVSTSSGGLAVSFEIVKFPSGWHDDVSHTLQRFNLVDTKGASLSLDGIRYQLEVGMIESNAQLNFSSPKTESLISLERAFLQVANEIVCTVENRALKEYMIIWNKYTKI